jgi:Streptomyces sporulation and cell division protein, SsgA
MFAQTPSQTGWETVPVTYREIGIRKMDTKKTAPRGVTQSITLELIDAAGRATPMHADLTYDPRDPYAVTAVFLTSAGNVRWTFGRELLIEGLYEPSGDGDVHVWPCLDADGRAVVIIELCSPDGEALVQANTGELTTFVEKMTAIVAPGNESDFVDVDGTIAAIFATEAA